MRLKATLPRGGHLFISVHDGQTSISLESSDGGSSQGQARSFSTGDWKGRPTLSKSKDELALHLDAEAGAFDFGIRGSSVEQLDAALEDKGEAVTLEEAGDDEGAKPMKPMEPMKPMAPMKPMR